MIFYDGESSFLTNKKHVQQDIFYCLKHILFTFSSGTSLILSGPFWTFTLPRLVWTLSVLCFTECYDWNKILPTMRYWPIVFLFVFHILYIRVCRIADFWPQNRTIYFLDEFFSIPSWASVCRYGTLLFDEDQHTLHIFSQSWI